MTGLRLLVASLLAWVAGCAPMPDLEITRDFVRAQEAFDRAEAPEDFLQAAAIYQGILDRGFVSGVVLYNQGNAYLRAGQRGRAIASYRQARRYLPREARLEANLELALGRDIDAASSAGLWDQIFFWQDRSSPREKLLLTAALSLLTAAFLLWGWLGGRVGARRATWVTLGLTLVLGISAGRDWSRFDRIESGVVGESVEARKGNGLSYQPAFTAPLEEGTEFVVLERRGSWLRLRLPNGLEGWIEETAAVVY